MENDEVYGRNSGISNRKLTLLRYRLLPFARLNEQQKLIKNESFFYRDYVESRLANSKVWKLAHVFLRVW